jgi:peroxiredoxin
VTDSFDHLPGDLPVPVDDGASDHLPGSRAPSVTLAATDGSLVDLSALAGTVVVYAYPRTGRPGEDLPAGWNEIPGARGCTPEACGFRDHHDDLLRTGASAVYGLSVQPIAYQQELVERLHLPYPILSDSDGSLRRAWRLPSLTVDGQVLLKRLTLVLSDGVVETVFYPVFPPDEHAAAVVEYLRRRDRQARD